MKIKEAQWERGDEVRLKTDPEGFKRLVLGYLVRETIMYEVQFVDMISYHYDFELESYTY